MTQQDNNIMERSGMRDSVEYKHFPLGADQIEQKQVNIEESTFEGFSAGIGNEDRGRDVIEPGAFGKTIQERVNAGKVKLLDQHSNFSTTDLWGKVIQAEERELTDEQRQAAADIMGADLDEAPSHRLWSKFQVSKSDQDAQNALQKIAEGILDGLSIGYKAVRTEFVADEDAENENADAELLWLRGQGTRRIKELAWWETSLVIFPMNRAAVAIPGSVKNLIEETSDIEDLDGRATEKQVRYAIRHLKQLIGEEGTEGRMAHQIDQIADYKRLEDRIEDLVLKVDNIDDMPRDAKEHIVLAYDQFRKQGEALSDAKFMAITADVIDEQKSETADDEKQGPVENKRLHPKMDWPLASRERDWDSEQAVDRWREKSDSEEEPSDRYKDGFLWYDTEEPDNFTSYKLPFVDVIDGEARAVPRGIFAAAAALEGARGGVDIPEDDEDIVRNGVEEYYERMQEKFGDDDIVVPWNEEEAAADMDDVEGASLEEIFTELKDKISEIEEYLLDDTKTEEDNEVDGDSNEAKESGEDSEEEKEASESTDDTPSSEKSDEDESEEDESKEDEDEAAAESEETPEQKEEVAGDADEDDESEDGHSDERFEGKEDDESDDSYLRTELEALKLLEFEA